MKKELVAAGFVLVSVVSPQQSLAADFSQFIVFGDSLSDTGNVFNITSRILGNPIPPSPPYSQGRFSNDKIWVDYLGENIGLTPTPITDLIVQLRTTVPEGVNYAFGGAFSGEGNFLNTPFIPGVLEQVTSFAKPFIDNNQRVDQNALYAVWAGGNDYLFSNNIDVNQIVNNISDSVGLLASAGAKNILVFNLPDLGKTPIALQTGNDRILTTLTTAHNTALGIALEQLSQTLDVNLVPVDVNTLFNQVLANPGEFGFQNVTDPCVVGNVNLGQAGIESVCTNPNNFLFFDSVHPTTGVHQLVANTALTSIRATKSVPEPSAIFGITALGALSVAAILKRKHLRNPVS